MVFRIDVRNSRELQATLLAIRNANREIQKEIRQRTKSEIAPEWKRLLAERAETRLEQRVLVDTAKVSVSNQNVRLSSASSTRKLSGGLKPSELGGAVEFGADPAQKTTYTRKTKNGSHSVTRRTRAQLRPIRAKGHVVYPVIAEVIPRFAALWVQTTVRTFYEAFRR